MRKVMFALFQSLFRLHAFLYNMLVGIFPPARGIIAKISRDGSGQFIRSMMLRLHAKGSANIIEVQGSKMAIDLSVEDEAWKKSFLTYASNTYERTTTGLFKKAVKPGNVIVDIGANIGYFTLLSAKLAGESGKVFAFEPEPLNYDYLQKNVSLNSYQNIVVEQKAVSDTNGTTKFFICSYNPASHSINQCEGMEAFADGEQAQGEHIEVETIFLDDFLKDKTDRVDLVKMDIEGAEFLAINGMRKIIENNKDIKIILEYCPLLLEKMGDSSKEMMDVLMLEYNFKVYIIGNEHAMEEQAGDMIEVKDYEHLSSFLKDSCDCVNLFMSRSEMGI
jgi:FkbM family methyltransferase